MFSLSIPGFREIHIEHLVLDFNGTLAIDGQLQKGVRELLSVLSEIIQIHVITADTFGSVRDQMKDIDCNIYIIHQKKQNIQKLRFIQTLNVEKVAAIGNGSNDSLMLKHAAISIALIQKEGAAARTLLCSDIICTNIIHALELFRFPDRMVATLRN